MGFYARVKAFKYGARLTRVVLHLSLIFNFLNLFSTKSVKNFQGKLFILFKINRYTIYPYDIYNLATFLPFKKRLNMSSLAGNQVKTNMLLHLLQLNSLFCTH